MNIKVRKINGQDYEDVINIAKLLHPGWFDKYAVEREIPLDIKVHQGFVAKIEDKIVGFITYSSEDGEIKISWLGILPELQRRGVGTALLKYLEQTALRLGVDRINVETLAESENYKPYKQTRAFYNKNGFQLESTRTITSKSSGERFCLAKYYKNINQ